MIPLVSAATASIAQAPASARQQASVAPQPEASQSVSAVTAPQDAASPSSGRRPAFSHFTAPAPKLSASDFSRLFAVQGASHVSQAAQAVQQQSASASYTRAALLGASNLTLFA